MKARLIIKGSPFTAARAAADRGIFLDYERSTVRESVGVCYASVEALNRWLCETTEAPFPPGSLLLWTEIREG